MKWYSLHANMTTIYEAEIYKNINENTNANDYNEMKTLFSGEKNDKYIYNQWKQ